jgi:serine/arginine repetitive matrix protein 2
MYAGERAASSAAGDPITPDTSVSHGDLLPASETGPAVEVIELANGQTIWSVTCCSFRNHPDQPYRSIVNGLRDDDEESVYTGRASRASFASEYSTRENSEGGLQVFVKEHGRTGSKGSNASFLSRKRTLQGQQRPETKVSAQYTIILPRLLTYIRRFQVFYSSSEQIGRLIENLSQRMDAGSFNFVPNPTPAPGPPGHSASSSLSTNDIHWTVEERLEHMLGSINPL